VSRQHELDVQTADGLVQAIGGNARRQKMPKAVLTRSALRRGKRIALIGAPATRAVMLLGKISEVQEVCERACNREGIVDRHARELVGERDEFGVLAAAGAFGQRSYSLDSAEDTFTRMSSEGFSQQVAKQPDIVTKRSVRIS
jgi:hypothetical protein